MSATELEYDGEEEGLWELQPIPEHPHRRLARPDAEGWWCFLFLNSDSAETALRVVARPEGLTILGYSEEPMLVAQLDHRPEQWLGPFNRVRKPT